MVRTVVFVSVVLVACSVTGARDLEDATGEGASGSAQSGGSGGDAGASPAGGQAGQAGGAGASGTGGAGASTGGGAGQGGAGASAGKGGAAGTSGTSGAGGTAGSAGAGAAGGAGGAGGASGGAGGKGGGGAGGAAGGGGTAAGAGAAGAAGAAAAGTGGAPAGAGGTTAGGGGSVSTCGDGVIDGGEECDDGNADPGDGCLACAVECEGGEKIGALCLRSVDASAHDGYEAECAALGRGFAAFVPCGADEMTALASAATKWGKTTLRVGLRQKEGQSGPKQGWEWEAPGCALPIPWGSGQPNDCGATCDGGEHDQTNCGVFDAGKGLDDQQCQQPREGVCARRPASGIAICGDGKVTGTEECDDGNKKNGDGCSALCTVECSAGAKGGPSRACFALGPASSSVAGMAAACATLGTGFVPAVLCSAEDYAAVDGLGYLDGGFFSPSIAYSQAPSATKVDQGWSWASGATCAPRWASSEPNDGGSNVETGKENCVRYDLAYGDWGSHDGLIDFACGELGGHPTLCVRRPAGVP